MFFIIIIYCDSFVSVYGQRERHLRDHDGLICMIGESHRMLAAPISIL